MRRRLPSFEKMLELKKQGLTNSAIAIRFGVTLQAVKNALARARRCKLLS